MTRETVDRVRQFMRHIASAVNSSDDHKKFVTQWVGVWPGKVLQVEAEGEKFYTVITKEKMWMEEGEYPSPDVIYRVKDAQVILDIFTGRQPFRNAMKDWSLFVIGAAHESVPLAQLIFNVMQAI